MKELRRNTTWEVVKIRPEKNSGLYGIWTHDLCDTDTVLYNWANKPTGSWTLCWFQIIPWSGEQTNVNIWKSCIWAAPVSEVKG